MNSDYLLYTPFFRVKDILFLHWKASRIAIFIYPFCTPVTGLSRTSTCICIMTFVPTFIFR